jgi:hypothetical protein
MAMKRFVADVSKKVDLILGAIAGLALGITDAGANAVYLVAAGLAVVLVGVEVGPHRVRLWQKMGGPKDRN